MFFDFDRAADLKRRGAERLAELDEELRELRDKLRAADAATRRRLEIEIDVVLSFRREVDDSIAGIRTQERLARKALRRFNLS